MPIIISNEPESQLTFEEVVPGSPNDPFTNQTRFASNPASPAEGAPVVPIVDGSKIVPAAPAPVPSPVSVPATQAESAPAAPAAAPTPLEKAVAEGTLEAYIAGLVKENTGSALRNQQSSYDKRIEAMQADLRAAREAQVKSEREGKLSSDDLSDDEKAILRDKYALEDERQRLQEYDAAIETHYRAVYVAALVQDYAQFGVTGDALEQFSEPEEMDVFVKDKELEFYRSGQHVTTIIPSNSATAPGAAAVPSEPAAPAGASAPTDLGGGAPSAPPAKPDTGLGIDSMARNLKSTPWTTIQFN